MALDRKSAIARRYAVSLQRELPERLLVELAFIYKANYDMHNLLYRARL